MWVISWRVAEIELGQPGGRWRCGNRKVEVEGRDGRGLWLVALLEAMGLVLVLVLVLVVVVVVVCLFLPQPAGGSSCCCAAW